MPFFGFLLMLTALVIAGVAGYFSVYGLAFIYQGAFISVVLMGGALEIGKLIATSYLYRYWADTGFFLKTYLLAAILGLMLITSSGIFGYLSSAYQQDTVGIKDVQARIELLDKEFTELSAREAEIDADINRVGSNYVTARLNLMKQYAGEKNALTERRNVIRTEKLKLSTKQLEVEAHTGPIIYIAKAMDKTIDQAVIWMSLLIIAVFDPLAIALTIAANSVMLKHQRLKLEAKAAEVVAEVEVPVEVEKIVEVPVERVVEKIVEVPVEVERKLAAGEFIGDAAFQEQFNDMSRLVVERSSDVAALEEAHNALSRELNEIKVERDRLIDDLRLAIEVDKAEDKAHNRLEIALQHQINTLNHTIEQAENDLAVAIEALEKRDTKIDTLERTNTELEQQIVDLRRQLRKFEMSATDRALLHQQNVVDSKK